jgi:hypothetical protein
MLVIPQLGIPNTKIITLMNVGFRDPNQDKSMCPFRLSHQRSTHRLPMNNHDARRSYEPAKDTLSHLKVFKTEKLEYVFFASYNLTNSCDN